MLEASLKVRKKCWLRTACLTDGLSNGPPNGPDGPSDGPDGPPNGPDGPPNGTDGPPNGPDGGAGDRRLRPG